MEKGIICEMIFGPVPFYSRGMEAALKLFRFHLLRLQFLIAFGIHVSSVNCLGFHAVDDKVPITGVIVDDRTGSRVIQVGESEEIITGFYC